MYGRQVHGPSPLPFGRRRSRSNLEAARGARSKPALGPTVTDPFPQAVGAPGLMAFHSGSKAEIEVRSNPSPQPQHGMQLHGLTRTIATRRNLRSLAAILFRNNRTGGGDSFRGAGRFEHWYACTSRRSSLTKARVAKRDSVAVKSTGLVMKQSPTLALFDSWLGSTRPSLGPDKSLLQPSHLVSFLFRIRRSRHAICSRLLPPPPPFRRALPPPQSTSPY